MWLQTCWLDYLISNLTWELRFDLSVNWTSRFQFIWSAVNLQICTAVRKLSSWNFATQFLIEKPKACWWIFWRVHVNSQFVTIHWLLSTKSVCLGRPFVITHFLVCTNNATQCFYDRFLLSLLYEGDSKAAIKLLIILLILLSKRAACKFS